MVLIVLFINSIYNEYVFIAYHFFLHQVTSLLIVVIAPQFS